MKALPALAGVLLLACVSAAHARFFIPKDTLLVFGMYERDSYAAEASYGLRRDWSVTAGWQRDRADDGDTVREYTYVRANWLLHRRGEGGWIRNLYLFGGPAWVRSNALDHGDEPGLQLGIWGDYETRRVYLKASLQTFWNEEFSQTTQTLQALWAPYAAEYGGIASWIGVQLQRRNGLSDATQVAPRRRFFQRRWWIDIGVGVNSEHRGSVFFDAMYLF
nr:MAG: hypothetical protein DIU74_05920 [Pseudomonadota bacterium]